MPRDSIANTFVVALSLCLVCSLMVSLAAVGLKPTQDRKAALDRKKNILEVSGFSPEQIEEAGGINELFESRFSTKIINMETGEEDLEGLKQAMTEAGKKFGDDLVHTYDQYLASKSKDKDLTDPVPASDDSASIKYREKFSQVFIMHEAGSNKPQIYIFPVRAYGLWSMMQGYLALEPDFQTVAGLTFYDQKETPGLGGEVENENWKAYWDGKKVYDPETGAVKLEVVKGKADTEYEVDGLSGATITSQGVSHMLEYWLGPEGFGPYIERNQKQSDSESQAASSDSGGNQNG